MLDLTEQEIQVTITALDTLAKRDGLSQPQQFAVSTQILQKLQMEVQRQRQAAEQTPDDTKKRKSSKKT